MAARRQPTRVSCLIACATSIAWQTACGLLEPKIWIYVDNGSSSAVEFRIDEEPSVEVPPQNVIVIKTRAGARHIVVRRGNETLFDETREFAETEDVSKYVLNPDKEHRYVMEAVKYRSRTNSFSGLNLPSIDALGDAVNRLRLLEPDPWVAGAYHDVFDEEPPETVREQLGVDVRRYRLCRLDPEDYDLIMAAKAAQQARTWSSALASSDLIEAVQRAVSACQ
jgi:hypothetical protein